MKNFVVAIAALSLAGSAFAINPNAPQRYTGTMTVSVNYLNEKKDQKITKPIVMTIAQSGRVDAVSEVVSFCGHAVVGSYRGFISSGGVLFDLTVKGSSLSGTAIGAAGNTADDGAVVNYQLNMKKAKN